MRKRLAEGVGIRGPAHGPRHGSGAQQDGTSTHKDVQTPRLQSWLSARSDRLARRWLSEVTSRPGRWDPEVVELQGEFLSLLTHILPGCLGPEPGRFDPTWEQAAELYGSFGALRGLAAGEIIEEFQLLEETLIRALFRAPPQADGVDMGMREVLHLSRVIGRGVTHAGVGYTDALFFALFQGTGVGQVITDEVLDEVRTQLQVLRADTDGLRQGDLGL